MASIQMEKRDRLLSKLVFEIHKNGIDLQMMIRFVVHFNMLFTLYLYSYMGKL